MTNYGFFRVACASPHLVVADCVYNADKIIDCVISLASENVDVIVFPELSVTSYSSGDLFLQKTLLTSAINETKRIAKETANCDSIILVGLPFAYLGSLYNTAAVLHKGKIIAIIPKTFIPNYSEFYEARYFSSGANVKNEMISLDSKAQSTDDTIPFGCDLLIKAKDAVLGVEICEDLWVTQPPSEKMSLSGANVICNLSASNEIIGKAEYRRLLVRSKSASNISAYLYADARSDESTQDVVYSGHNIIAENGTILAEAKLFSEDNVIISDIDIERLNQERLKTTTFSQCKNSSVEQEQNYCIIEVESKETKISPKDLKRFVAYEPFVPQDKNEKEKRCSEVIELQSQGLAKRLRHINANCCVVGLSGGLDSTLAFLVTLRAFEICGLDKKRLFAVTMPCFGTTDRTYKNACTLAKCSGASLLEIPISDAVKQHFKDIDQDENNHDTTYENSQARERTQVLMDVANKNGGIVIGTGDLSELALGWCTYNGDHMSMYGVNSSIPKTLVRHLVKYFADTTAMSENVRECLIDILETPVSPELLPPENDAISQKTEDIVGPYQLHDFFLYYLLRFGFSPKKILYLADASDLPYSHEEKVKWLKVFYKRFFSQQFKRSCMPDGAKVGTVNLSPRGDWRMPSDASAKLWLDEIDDV